MLLSTRRTNRYHDKLANYFDQKLVMLEQEKREIQANLNRNLAEFRNEYQVRATELFWGRCDAGDDEEAPARTAFLSPHPRR